jgi:hypothetical protein
MPTTTHTEPSPCPYCGEPPQTFQTALTRRFRIACMNAKCCVRPDTSYRRMDENRLLAAWNRGTGRGTSRLLDALKQAQMALNTARRFQVPAAGLDSYQIASAVDRAVREAEGAG